MVLKVMNKRQLRLLPLMMVFLIGAVTAFSQNDGKKHLKQDENFIIGKLDNGLTYYIRKNENPKKSAEFFIAHNVGSLQEEENQRGLAHFLEHMAFNGTKNFPDKNLLNSLAGIGVKFGTNINAYTSMDRTVYNISAVPVARESVIDSVLLMLHDWSCCISCEPDEINAERGVIREEWRRGDDARTRMMKAISEAEQSGSRFADRGVIGLVDIINTFTPKTLTDYYHKWYRPDLQAIFIVGDIEPRDIEARVKRIFSAIPKAVNPAPRLTYEVPVNAEPIICRYTDPELKASSVRIVVKFPMPKGEERLQENFIKDKLMTDLFYNMISDRITKNVKNKKTQYKTAVPSLGEIYYASRLFRITAVQKGDEYEKALINILSDYETVKKYGFCKEEFKTAKVSKAAQLKLDGNRNKNPKNIDYVNAAIESFTRGDALIDRKDYYKISAGILQGITVEEVNNFVAGNFGEKNLIVIFAGAEKERKKFSSDERVKFIIDSIRRAPLEEYTYVPDNTLKFNVALKPVKMGMPQAFGAVPGAEQVTLPNGNKVIWIENKNPDSMIKFRAANRGGFAIEKDDSLGMARLMKMYLGNYMVNGLDKKSFTRVLSDNSIKLMQNMTDRYDLRMGSFANDNPEIFFQTLYLLMSDVKADNASLKEFKQKLSKQLSNTDAPLRIFQDSCQALLFRKTKMNRKLTPEIVASVTAKDLETLYRKHFADSRGMTFFFEGPMSFEKARPYLEKYLANLPYGAEKRVTDEADRSMQWNKGKIDLRYKTGNQVSTKASVAIEVKANMPLNPHNYICARFLTSLLQERYTKSIREEKGGTYTVGVEDVFSIYPENYITFKIDFDTDPKLVDELIECVWAELKDIAKNVPDESDIGKIKLYLNKRISSKDKYEISYINKAVSVVLNEPYVDADDLAIINSVTAKDVRDFTKKVMKQKNFATFIIEP